MEYDNVVLFKHAGNDSIIRELTIQKE